MKMSNFKIPKFLSKVFNSKTDEQKVSLTEKYKVWYSEDITELWVEGFKARIEELIKLDEASTLGTSFEFQQQVISNRAERLILRSLIKEMNYEV